MNLRALAAIPCAMLVGCTFHTTAYRWYGLTGADGRPVFVKATTNVGMNLFILVPLLGNTTVGSMLEETAAAIAGTGGNGIRVIQTSADVFWYGFPPLTWVLTPVSTRVAIEYRPSPAEIEQLRRDDPEFDAHVPRAESREPTSPGAEAKQP